MDKVVQFRTADATRAGQAQMLILHRITAAHDDGTYTTAGDANANPDLNPLHREQITGMGRLLVPDIGLPSLWWNTRNYLPLGLWLTATLLALTAVARSRFKEPETPEPPIAERERTDSSLPQAGSGLEERARGRKRSRTGRHAAYGPGLIPGTGGNVARRTVFGLAGMAVASGLAAYPGTRSTAALTASTSTGTSFASASSFPPSPGRAGAFALLARMEVLDKSDATKVGSSVSGLVGTTEGTISGYPTTHQNSTDAKDAMTDANALFNELRSRTATTTLTATTLAGTLAPGVYSYPNGNVTLGNLTLDAQWNPNAVFIVRVKALDTNPAGITINLINGAKAANVYWCADTNIDIRAKSLVVGTWIAVNFVGLENPVTLTGRLLVLGATQPLRGKILTANATITRPS